MGFIKDLKQHLTASELFGPAARTANANSSSIDLEGYEGDVLIVLHSAAGQGTNPTLDVKIQDSADNTTFADVAGYTFAQVDNAAGGSLQTLKVDTRAVRRYIRAVATIGGTSPSFTFSVIALGQQKVQ